MLIAHEKRYKLQASVKRPASNLNAWEKTMEHEIDRREKTIEHEQQTLAEENYMLRHCCHNLVNGNR